MLKKWRLAYQGNRLILDSITDILIVIDTEYRIILANPGALRALGVEKEEDALGTLCHRLLTGTDQLCDDCAPRRALETGCSARCVRTWPIPEGGSRNMEESAFPIRNKKDQIVGVVVHARPVDEGGAEEG